MEHRAAVVQIEQWIRIRLRCIELSLLDVVRRVLAADLRSLAKLIPARARMVLGTAADESAHGSAAAAADAVCHVYAADTSDEHAGYLTPESLGNINDVLIRIRVMYSSRSA